jgi:hypothetical protein
LISPLSYFQQSVAEQFSAGERQLGSFCACHAHESCWSNPMQMTGQVECKWVGKSVQFPILHRSKRACRNQLVELVKSGHFFAAGPLGLSACKMKNKF